MTKFWPEGAAHFVPAILGATMRTFADGGGSWSAWPLRPATAFLRALNGPTSGRQESMRK